MNASVASTVADICRVEQSWGNDFQRGGQGGGEIALWDSLKKEGAVLWQEDTNHSRPFRPEER